MLFSILRPEQWLSKVTREEVKAHARFETAAIRRPAETYGRMLLLLLGVLSEVGRAECVLTKRDQSTLNKALRLKKNRIPKSGLINGRPPLRIASEAGCCSYLDRLVNAGFDVNTVDTENSTALCAAAMFGHLDCVDELLRLNAEVDHPCLDGLSAMIFASRENKPDVVKRLLKAGADVNWAGGIGMTALAGAAQVNSVEMIKLLLDAGADVNLPNGTFIPTPLGCAVEANATAAATVLVAHGASLDTMIQGKANALHQAAAFNNTGLIRVLVEAGALVDLPDNTGAIALHHAARNGNAEMLRYLRAAGSWLLSTNGDGLNVLHLAAQSGNVPAVKEILSWKVIDVNEEASEFTPLVFAAFHGHSKVVRLLVEEGADPNQKGRVSRVGAVEAATLSGKPEILRFLLQSGGEIVGKTLIEMAQRHLRTMMLNMQAIEGRIGICLGRCFLR